MLRILVVIYWALTGVAIAAEPPIGHVKNVAGNAFVTTAGEKIKAAVGSPVYRGSLLETGAKSSMGIILKDETVLSFGADTVFTVDEYLYSPGEKKLKFGSKLAKGSLNYVSGVIEKLKPDAVTIGTPSGVIGVRGTQFLLRVEE